MISALPICKPIHDSSNDEHCFFTTFGKPLVAYYSTTPNSPIPAKLVLQLFKPYEVDFAIRSCFISSPLLDGGTEYGSIGNGCSETIGYQKA